MDQKIQTGQDVASHGCRGVESIAAGAVKVGDFVFDSGLYAPDKWCRVRKIIARGDRLSFDLGHVTLGNLHPRQGIAVNHDRADMARKAAATLAAIAKAEGGAA